MRGSRRLLLHGVFFAALLGCSPPLYKIRPPVPGTYWNSWIESRRSGEAVSRVEPGETYNFDFDLAAFDYGEIAKYPATASVRVDEALREELDRYTGDTARFHVKPILGGTGLAFLSGESDVRPVEVDLTRLRNPPAGWSSKEPLHLLSKTVRAAQMRIGVRAESEGCAAIGLSIWNDAMDRPIDHLVREVRIGGQPNAPPCGPGDPSKALRGSLISLLAIPPDQMADAALHIFEMSGNEPESHAVFKVRDGALLTWRLERRLSGYVTGESFVNRLRESRSRRDYGVAGGSLTSVLFPATNEDATEALRSLTEFANRPERPVVFARLVDAAGKNMFLPLGLVRLASGRLLGDVVTVTQPLPKTETYSAADRCVGGWTMVLPENLGSDVDASYLTPLRSPIPHRISRWTDFKSYVGSQPTEAKGDSPKDANKGEGFLLLAHHADGEIWFVRGPDSIQSEAIARRYPRGSVAVLSACALGDPAVSGEVSLLEKLNGLGIEAAVVSPFEIQGPVGARFAFHFANEVQKAREQREGADLTSLFRRTTAAVRADASVATQRDAVYEFVVAGNGGLRLCR